MKGYKTTDKINRQTKVIFKRFRATLNRLKAGCIVNLDCEKNDCVHYGGLGCHGADDPLNQTCCRLDLNEATKCLNDPDYPMYETMDDISVDDYMKHLKKKWPLDKKAQKPVKV